MSHICGAKTRSGAPCQRPALAGKKRCRLHGGASTGAPKGNKNSLKHGIYSRVIREEDREIYDSVATALGSLDHEIAIVRMQLHNTLEAQNNARRDAEEGAKTGGLELQKFHEREASEFTAGDEHVYERVDYNGHIDRLTARIAMLEKTRAELIEAEAKRRENEDPDGDEAPKWEITIVPAKKG
jgi:hypothetical protein